jgi:hypothetical protein
MKKVILFVCICLCCDVGYAKQNKIEIGFNYGEDCIIYHLRSYFWGGEQYGFYYENFSPRTINIFGTIPLNNNIRIGTKLGYSGRSLIFYDIHGSTSRNRINLNGGYFHVLGLVNVPLIKEKLSVYSVVSPGFHYYQLIHNDSIEGYHPSAMRLKSTTSGFVQILSLGFDFAVSKSVRLTTEIEKPLYYLIVGRGYTDNKRYDYGYPVANGFTNIGIIMGLTFSL